jgi:hypothetical protein
MNAVLNRRPPTEQQLLDMARYSQIEHAARRARQHVEYGHRLDEVRCQAEIRDLIADLTGWVR